MEVVALCNVDDSKPHLGWAAEAFPKAEKFSDYRKLLDQANSFDAVSVSTPDFMHAPISLAAMALGKHVFCQKPLAHTVHEVRLMEESAKKHNLVTQMGNQIQAHHAYRNGVQLIHDGAIGKVREVHSWQAGNMRWLLTEKMPTTADPVPPSLNWDLWLGVAPERALQEGSVPPPELARVAGFRHWPTWRFRLPHLRSGVHGARTHGPDDHRSRRAADQKIYVDAAEQSGVPVPGHLAHGG